MAGSGTTLSPLFQHALEAINSAIEGMNDEQMNWRPEGKWSSAQILEHLALAFSSTRQRMEGLLSQTTIPELPSPTFRQRVAALLVLRLGYIPTGRKSPPHILPQGIPPQEAVDAARNSLALLDTMIHDCEAKFGDNARIMDHVILGPLSAHGWRKFHNAHTLHHTHQIVELRIKIRKQ
jgi:hypothetical protein